jgi:hypothetical protein
LCLSCEELLLSRQYRVGMVESAINRAKAISRDNALKKVMSSHQPFRRPVLAVPYDPRLPRIQSIQAKHWRSMITQDRYLKDVFPQLPLTAYTRQNTSETFWLMLNYPNLKPDQIQSWMAWINVIKIVLHIRIYYRRKKYKQIILHGTIMLMSIVSPQISYIWSFVRNVMQNT